MSARILVVDDILPNVKLLEAKLRGEYYDVLTATNGPDALEIAEKEKPDVILLDIMMPGMDGFEVCERLKANPATVHIPVVMVTALTDATDRVHGLEAGADDFLSKPVNDVALMSRVRSLVRLKMIVDEWQMRENTASHLGVSDENKTMMAESVENASVLIVEDNTMENDKMSETLKRDDAIVSSATLGEIAMEEAKQKDFDLIVVSLNMAHEDGLRLCSFFRSNERSRSVPILMVSEEQDMERIARGLEIGANDYILRPLDRNEFIARVRTQIRRKRYQDRLRSNYELSLNMALTDELTGLYNRRYLTAHLDKVLAKFDSDKKTVTILMLDIDHFKEVNDTHGHDVGDDVLRVFSDRISKCLRSFDTVARMGGEEFLAILPDAPKNIATMVAERLRRSISNKPIPSKNAENGELSVTVSVGGFIMTEAGFSAEDVIKKADDALYEAKNAGRNCCVFTDIGKINPDDIVEKVRPIVSDNVENKESLKNDNIENNTQGEDAPNDDSGFFALDDLPEPFAEDMNKGDDNAVVTPPVPTPAQKPANVPNHPNRSAEPDFFIDPSLTDPMNITDPKKK